MESFVPKNTLYWSIKKYNKTKLYSTEVKKVNLIIESTVTH